MPSAYLSTEEEIIQLVNLFYESIHKDAMLDRIFKKNAALGQRASELVKRMTKSLWRHYQMSRDARQRVGVA